MVAVQNVIRQNHIVKKLLETSAMKFLAGFAIFLVSAAIFGFLSLNAVIKRGEKVTVPNVVNKSVADALDLLSERGLELRKGGSRNSSFIPENYVVSQDPLPGSVVKGGRPITVVISLGSRTSMVPNLVGKPLREARVELNRAGLAAGRFSRMHHLEEIDTVLAQSPAPNRQVDRETPINMLLSLGPAPHKYRTPNLIGLSLEGANKLLEAMGVTAGDIVTKIDLNHRQGTVLDQEPRPGALISEGSSISLVMSTLQGEGARLERKVATFIYQLPYGFWSRSVRIEVADPEGSRTVYNEVDEPGAGIKVVFGYSAQCTVKVYVDEKLETERTIR